LTFLCMASKTSFKARLGIYKKKSND